MERRTKEPNHRDTVLIWVCLLILALSLLATISSLVAKMERIEDRLGSESSIRVYEDGSFVGCVPGHDCED